MSLAEIKERWTRAMLGPDHKLEEVETSYKEISARLDNLMKQIEERQKERLALSSSHSYGSLVTITQQRTDLSSVMKTLNHSPVFRPSKVQLIGMDSECVHEFGLYHSMTERNVDYAEILRDFLELRCAG